jgi:hypothetical protein
MDLCDFTVRARNRSAFTSAKSEILAGIGFSRRVNVDFNQRLSCRNKTTDWEEHRTRSGKNNGNSHGDRLHARLKRCC